MNIYCNYLTITNKTFIFIHAYFVRMFAERKNITNENNKI
jgi:hypothetical protein